MRAAVFTSKPKFGSKTKILGARNFKVRNKDRTAAQLSFKAVSGWGGPRRGAGRPNKTGQVNHMKRAKVKSSTPLHLTWRLKKDLVNLRCGEVLALFRTASARAKNFGLRVVHFSIQSNHLHLIVECKSNEGLKRGTRSLAACLGKGVRKLIGGRGSVFAGRFDLKVLTNPTMVRNAMAYVLQNFSKHARLLNHVDRYSSAPNFSRWQRLLGSRAGPILTSGPPLSVSRSCSWPTFISERSREKAGLLPDFLSTSQSWLAREGWMRAPVT
ncbi:MAG: hypothetical protein AB7F86_06580 [Bdellovibrionales bacterium]